MRHKIEAKNPFFFETLDCLFVLLTTLYLILFIYEIEKLKKIFSVSKLKKF